MVISAGLTQMNPCRVPRSNLETSSSSSGEIFIPAFTLSGDLARFRIYLVVFERRSSLPLGLLIFVVALSLAILRLVFSGNERFYLFIIYYLFYFLFFNFILNLTPGSIGYVKFIGYSIFSRK